MDLGGGVMVHAKLFLQYKKKEKINNKIGLGFGVSD